ncbi:hypothetical protein EMIHUDRAFT_451573 [Emiliania huxleyi CCMP1516]|uniref:PPM-type phosphatase domain-containing protein n=2 Tax=Emiliania huxleyi TaxID=2903 RepID=A0A0D3IXG3_EMIH1|nr:hypothetical protein EMIHUDRAFT_451573 [Emiliania huxleyi CCMP1516]EOD15948.1 hypothetical protein EMIHUDRAFT_451573 [Emiliania huxleyi CCMP1516]|eukprot:XP_005768377.1 hypothetical protein EMIHUDRAFT_451573 [Emiliania huxleyi CCMP1516]
MTLALGADDALVMSLRERFAALAAASASNVASQTAAGETALVSIRESDATSDSDSEDDLRAALEEAAAARREKEAARREREAASEAATDATFVASCGGGTLVWGVLDGHGPENGRIASWAGAAALKEYFLGNVAALEEEPEEAMTSAFKAAHDGIGAALRAKYGPGNSAEDGTSSSLESVSYLLGADGEPIDGGTTATVRQHPRRPAEAVALAFRGGFLPDGAIGFEQLSTGDHTPTSLEEEEPIDVFRRGAGGEWELDPDSLARVREDRPTTMMLMPSETGFPQQSLAVTRALGDHFFQQHGAPHTLGVVLLLGSDGLWDVWDYTDVLDFAISAVSDAQTEAAVARSVGGVVEATRERSQEYFGEAADNIAAILVSFDITPTSSGRRSTR